MKVAINPIQKHTIAKSGRSKPNIEKVVVDRKLVNKIMADEVAVTTSGWTPIASMIGTVITANVRDRAAQDHRIQHPTYFRHLFREFRQTDLPTRRHRDK